MRTTTILVTGSHRSGTTFVGQMLALPPAVGYWSEPFNIRTGLTAVDDSLPYITTGSALERKYRPVIDGLLHGRARFRPYPANPGSPRTSADRPWLRAIVQRRLKRSFQWHYYKTRFDPRVRRYLIKDPLLCLSSAYLHREYQMDTVILVRHPASFVSSIRRLGWKFGWSAFRRQAPLLRDHLGPVLEAHPPEGRPELEQSAVLWLCINTVLARYLDDNPTIIHKTLEAVCRDPRAEFRDLYEQLGLPFDGRVADRIARHTGAHNPIDAPGNQPHVLERHSAALVASWRKQLSPGEVDTIRGITGELARRWYDEASW